MKKLFFAFTILTIFRIAGYSQITLDFQSAMTDLYYFQLNGSNTKYYNLDQTSISNLNQFSIYNLDGTLFKTISLPPKPDPTAHLYVYPWYITESLFDNDPSTIEYLVCYYYDSIVGWSTQNYKLRIIRENGTILLDEPNGYTGNVYETEEGPKLRIIYRWGTGVTYQTKVFDLPGEMPLFNDNPVLKNDVNPFIYPNPNNGSFFIKLNSTETNINTIELYDLSGKLLNTYKSNSKTVEINNPNLENGIYFINTISNAGNSRTKMIIQK